MDLKSTVKLHVTVIISSHYIQDIIIFKLIAGMSNLKTSW